MSQQNDRLDRYCLEYPDGAVLFRAGDQGDQMYVIQKGKVRISVAAAGVEKTLAVLGCGEFFGEMAVLNDRPRSATATVEENSQLLVIDKAKFEEMIRQHPDLALRMIRRLADRLEKTDRALEITLHREPRARIILGLSDFATKSGETTDDGVRISLSIGALAEHTGLDQLTVRSALDQLERHHLVSLLGEDAVLVRDVENLQRYLSYLEMKEKYGD